MGYEFGRAEAPPTAPRMMMGGPPGKVMDLRGMLSAAGKVDPALVPAPLRGVFGRFANLFAKVAAPEQRPAASLGISDIFAPAAPGEAKTLARLARRGVVVPLSLRFWIEEVGKIDLNGRHPLLAPPSSAASGGRMVVDPLAIEIDADDIADHLAEYGREDDPVPLILAYSAADKAAADINDTDWEDGLAIDIPNAAADAPLGGSAEHPGLLPYLRLSFRWGGFPGWADQADAPTAKIDQLKEAVAAF